MSELSGVRWRLEGRVVVAGDSRRPHVVVGETCGAPSNEVARWITDRHNYDIMPWYRRVITRAPKLTAREEMTIMVAGGDR